MPAVWRPSPDATVTPPRIPTEPLRFTKTLTLAAVPTAVSAARRYVRDELTRVGLSALIEDAELVASELVTNAMLATGVVATDPAWAELEGLAVIRIRLVFTQSGVIVEVWDRDTSLPVQQQSGDDAEGGRGLIIVNALCTRWDSRRVDDGKVVWGELPRPAPKELPRRMPKRPVSSGQRGPNGSSPRTADRPEEVRGMRRNGGGGTG